MIAEDDSGLALSFRGCEIIIVNDGSPDSKELERALDPYRGGIRHVVQALDQDDQREPEFLSFYTGIVQGDPSLDVHYCDARIFGHSPRSGHSVMELTPFSSADVAGMTEQLSRNDMGTAVGRFEKVNAFRLQPKITASLFFTLYAPRMFLSLSHRAGN